MKAARIKSSPKSANRAQRLSPFGPPPILDGEDGAAYDELLAQVSAAVKPADILEQIWISDIVDLTWEILRFRRFKINLLRLNAKDSLVTELAATFVSLAAGKDDQVDLSPVAEEFAEGWVMREPGCVKAVKDLLKLGHQNIEVVMAIALSENIDVFERIERIIAMLEGRRNAMLREIDRHRSTLGTVLRQTVTQIEDGEYHVVDVETPDRDKTP